MSSLYERLCPQAAKTVVETVYGALPYGVKFGQAYRNTRHFLRESEFWDLTRLQAYQVEKLRQLVTHAANTVPFYQRLRASGTLQPDTIRSLADLRSLPLMSKAEIRANVKDFVSSAFAPHALHEATTGGSSGEPFHFYCTKDARRVEWAFVHDLWSRVGFSPSDWRVVLRGAHIAQGLRWQAVPKTREFVLSSHHMDDATMRQYHDLIRSHGFKFLYCYPSAGYLFAAFLLREGLRLPLKAVLATSEQLHVFQRKAMEEAFQCRVFSFYGQSERVCIAGECECIEHYHVQPQYGITELLDPDGNEVAAPGQIGEIVATGFFNDAMPFIRYRTGDHALLSTSPCRCGRHYRLLERIVGRSYEYVVTRQQTLVSLTALIPARHFSAYRRLRKMQVLQDRIGEIDVLVVRGPDYTQNDENEILNGIRGCVPDGLTVHIRYVEDIAPTERGKHVFMIQRLSLANMPHVNSSDPGG